MKMCYAFSMIDEVEIPYVGQMVNYHLDEGSRFAAIVTEVHPQVEEERPAINLVVFLPDGKLQPFTKVLPYSTDPDDDERLLRSKRWSFNQEIMVETDGEEADPTEFKGTVSNLHVGVVWSTN